MSSLFPHPIGNTPLVPIRKLVKPHKISPTLCQIHAKCEFRNPSGSIWDRRVCHEIQKEAQNAFAFVTGGVSDLCLSLAWAGAAADVSVAVLPGGDVEEGRLQQILQGLGANVILSYQQDPDRSATQECLEGHVKTLEATSGTRYHRIMPIVQADGDSGPYDSFMDELDTPDNSWDVVVCAGQDPCLVQTLRKKFPANLLVAVDFTENTFTETLGVNNSQENPGIKWVRVSDGECYDMARRLIREEGLPVAPISGGIMAAAIKEMTSITSSKTILVILPDSLQNTSGNFLSVDWMVQKGYYSAAHLESLFWWYEMALENINPPEVLIAPPETPIKSVCVAMTASSTERCVVVTASGGVVGLATRDSLEAKMKLEESLAVGDCCSKQFGLIDSKAQFSELERLLRKYNWVVNMHRVPLYSTATNSEPHLNLQTSEQVLGAINMADFMHYKRKIERHHLTEFGLAMSDGIPSDVWLERFDEQLKLLPTRVQGMPLNN